MTKEEFINKYGGKSRYEKFVIGQDIKKLFDWLTIEKDKLILYGVKKDLERSFEGRTYSITYDEAGQFIKSVTFGDKDD